MTSDIGRFAGLRIRAVAVGPDELVAAIRLMKRCSPADRLRRAGSIDPARAAAWLLPRSPRDVAVAAVTPDGEFVAVVNANADPAQANSYDVAAVVAPGWRRRGLASALLRAAAAWLPPGATATGSVRADHLAGRALLAHTAPGATTVYDGSSIEFALTAAAVTDVRPATPPIAAGPGQRPAASLAALSSRAR